MPTKNYTELFLNYLQKNEVLTEAQIISCLQETVSTSNSIIQIILQKKYCSENTLMHHISQFNREHTTNLFPELNFLEKKTDFKDGHIPTQVADGPTVDDPPSSSIIPKNRYILLENLGEGGMGVVQKAKDCVLGREVALKKINNLNSLSSQFSQKSKIYLWRLSREAEITAILEHPNIIPLYDLQYNEQGELYFTMRKVEGDTLSTILRNESENKGSAPLEKRLSIFFKVCDAVSYAHSKNIIHRDLKPDNIMVGKFGEVYVMDWGIAKKIHEDDISEDSLEKTAHSTAVKEAPGEKKTLVDIVSNLENQAFQGNLDQVYATIGGLGTPGYMAPEQHKNASQATVQSDIYSLGIILRQCFVLFSPYEEIQLLYKNPFNTTKPYTSKKPSTASKKPSTSSKRTPVEEQKEAFDALIPSDIRAIIQKATHSVIENRYASVKEFVYDIECYQKNVRVSAREYTLLELLSKWIRRNKIIVRSLLVALLLLGSLGIYLHLEKKQQREQQVTDAYQKAAVEELIAQKNEKNAGLQIKSLLKAIHYVNIALSLKPMDSELEQKKYEMGQKLIQIACQSKDYNLADYVLTEMNPISFLTFDQKNQLKEYIKKEESRVVTDHLERLHFWMKELKRKPNWKTKDKAMFEICQMKEKEVFQELLALAQQGTHYFLHESAKDSGSIYAYHVILEIFRDMKNSEAAPVLVQQLEEMAKILAERPESKYEEAQITYMLEILRMVAELKGKSLSKRVQEIRNRFPPQSRFFRESEDSYRRLIFFEDIPPETKTAEDFWIRGSIKLAKEDISGAIEDWTQCIQIDPEYVEAYLSRAQAYGRSQYEKALEDYAAVLQIIPDHPRVYELRGKLKLDMNDPQGTVDDFEKFLEKNQERGGIYLNLGIAKRFLRDFKGSIAALDKAVKGSPTQAYPLVLRGMAKYGLGDFKGALEDYNQAILIHPDHANAFSNRGVVNMSLGDFESAIYDLNHAIELDKFDTLNFFNRADCKERMKNYHGAIYDYNQTLQVDPQYFPAAFRLIQCYKRVEKLAAAIDTYEQILAIQALPHQVYIEAIQGLVNLVAIHITREYAKGETTSLKKYILLFNKYATPLHLKYSEVNAVLQKIEQAENEKKEPK